MSEMQRSTSARTSRRRSISPQLICKGRLGELENYRDKPVIVVCRMGTSAGAAVKQLQSQGFSQAQRMAGGMMSWDEQRLPVTNNEASNYLHNSVVPLLRPRETT